MLAPAFDDDPRLGETVEQLPVQQLVAELRVVSRTVWLSGYVLYDCLDECGKRLALILLESRNTII